MSGCSDRPGAGYITVDRAAETETVINRSRFIGAAYPAAAEAEAREILAAVRKRHHDATHNCYAYSVERGAVCRFSDDGEPGGTAGLPMMEVVKRLGVTDVIVVVTRYFGGILLGAGGLVRAYSGAAAAALKAAGRVEFVPARRIAAAMDYGRFTAAEPYIRSFDGAGVAFAAEVTAELLVPEGEAAAVCDRLTQLTDGRARIDDRGPDYMKKHLI